MKYISINRNLLFITFLLQLTFSSLHAQDSTETVFFKAMKDELDRSMDKLVLKDYSRPFYISYTLEDIKTVYVSSSLGALNTSSERSYRSWSNRILCGDYQLNDENYIDATRRRSSGDGSLQLPLDNDYYGIRRALWIISNNTYKSAAENYKSKLAALKEKNLAKDDLQIPDFCKSDIVTKSFKSKSNLWSKENLEWLTRNVSKVFLNYPDIYFSEVSVYQIHADMYFMSSEGSRIKEPLEFLFFNVAAYCQSSDGDNISEQMRYIVSGNGKLLPQDSIINDVNTFAAYIIEKSKVPLLNENYNGPVFFLGQASAEMFMQGMLTGTDNLCAYREPLYNNSQMSMYYGQNINSLESKLNKPVVSKNISVYDYTKLYDYNGKDLVGRYDVDAEGVEPNDTLVLIEKGILKNLYNGRTPTRNITNSNGHRKYIFQSGNFISDLGPGVMVIKASESKPLSSLKESLINQAKEDGLEYALMVKPLNCNADNVPFMVYKVNVSDGSEQIIRGATMNAINISSLKKISETSSETILYNGLMSSSYAGDNGGIVGSFSAVPTGTTVSVIAPEGLILQEVEFEHQPKALVSDKPIVDSPLKK